MEMKNSPAIPDRLFFRIGDVAELLGVKPHVLRYWESEFSVVAPQKSSTGQRIYRRKDVETLVLIRHLLHEERYSIEGARKKIKELRKEGVAIGSAHLQGKLRAEDASERVREAQNAQEKQAEPGAGVMPGAQRSQGAIKAGATATTEAPAGREASAAPVCDGARVERLSRIRTLAVELRDMARRSVNQSN